MITCNNGPNGDMFMNYMDYTDDAAMFMFTTQQVLRMRTALEVSRRGLVSTASTVSASCWLPTTRCSLRRGFTYSRKIRHRAPCIDLKEGSVPLSRRPRERFALTRDGLGTYSRQVPTTGSSSSQQHGRWRATR